MTAALARVCNDLAGAAFVVVPAAGLDTAAIEQMAGSLHRDGGRARLCLAADRRTLGALDAAAIDSDRIGLMLDGVDADTPLSELVWDRLEAVRFEARFVARAARELRLGCALDAMLGLARDMGLCTLGVDAVPDGGSVTGRAAFDYVLPVSSPLVESAARRRAGSAAFSLNR